MATAMYPAPTQLTAGEQSPARIVSSARPQMRWVPPRGLRGRIGWRIEAVVDGDARLSAAGDGSSIGVAWPFEEISSRSVVNWRVQLHCADGVTRWSEWSEFRAPLWNAEDWQASWISPPEPLDIADRLDRGATTLVGHLTLPLMPERALLYATALGIYTVSINGRRVGDVELAPGTSSYQATLYAQGYEVTQLLQVGENRIEVTLSDGWFRGRNSGSQKRNAWGERTAFLAQLEVFSEGQWSVAVATDDSWVSGSSPVIRADLMLGQGTDFRVSPSEGAIGNVELATVAAPVPSWSPAPPVRCVSERRPHSITPIREGVSIVDTGQNLSGWVRISGLGHSGETTLLEFGEHLDAEGDLTTAHLSMPGEDGTPIPYVQVDAVTSNGEEPMFEPRHTVHGFRYVRVTHPGRVLTSDQVTVVVVHSDLAQTGRFHSSDDRLNRFHDIVEWSFRGNMVDIPTDCPTRERSGWTGDYQTFVSTAASLFDVRGFSEKWMRAVRDDQSPSGIPAAMSPDPSRTALRPNERMSGTGGSAGWGDAVVEVPWQIYRAYGDTDILRDNWDAMHAWVDYALRCAGNLRHRSRVERSATPAAHERFIWDAPFHFGEWTEPKTRREDGTLEDPFRDDPVAFMMQDRGELGTAFLYRSVSTLAAIAGVLGDDVQEGRLSALAEKIKEAWQTEFLREGGRTVEDSQGAYVRALAFGLIPSELRPAAASRLAELVELNDTRLTTGFISSGLLPTVLADFGYVDLAYRLLFRRGEPSWMVMLDRGATTVWEEWDGVDEQGRASASLNHYSKGAVLRFFHENIIGLRQAGGSAGWQKFRVAPLPGGGVESASFEYMTPRGLIAVAWKDDRQAFRMSLVVPTDAEAEVTLPDGDSFRVAPGDHYFEVVKRRPTVS